MDLLGDFIYASKALETKYPIETSGNLLTLYYKDTHRVDITSDTVGLLMTRTDLQTGDVENHLIRESGGLFAMMNAGSQFLRAPWVNSGNIEEQGYFVYVWKRLCERVELSYQHELGLRYST